MKKNIYFGCPEKGEIYANFSKKDIVNHKGQSGLKYYLIVMYLRKHLETFREVSFTLDKLLEECGYSTNTHSKVIYDDFRTIIQEYIIGPGFAESNENILSARPSKMVTLTFSQENDIFSTVDNHVQITVEEYEKIVNSNIENINKSILFGVYLYIKQFIYLNKYTIQISYPSEKQIKDGVGVSSLTTVKKAIKILEQLKMIYVDRDLYIQDATNNSSYVRARNVYALEEKYINNDIVLDELGHYYKQPVCRKANIPNE